MRWLFAILLILLVVLQYRLWIAEGSLAEKTRLERQVEEYTRVNASLRERNAVLEREVMELVITGMLNKQVAHELGTAEKTVKVFVLAGQSNMEGKAANTLFDH